MKGILADISERLGRWRQQSEELHDARATATCLEWHAELEALLRDAQSRDTEREALIHEVTLVLSCTSVPRLLELIMDSVIRLSRAERGFLVLSRSRDNVEIVAARNMERRPVDSAASQISRRIVESVLTENRAIRLDDALNTPPFSLAESVTRLKLLSVLCVPLSSDSRILGALYLENRHATGVFSAQTENLVKEFTDRIGVAIVNAESREHLERARDELQGVLTREPDFEGVAGTDPAFHGVLDTIRLAAKGDIPVIIEGESGTGKELLARAVHRGSVRRGHPFVSVNCAALPHALLESELFGHTRGAFTGAIH